MAGYERCRTANGTTRRRRRRRRRTDLSLRKALFLSLSLPVFLLLPVAYLLTFLSVSFSPPTNLPPVDRDDILFSSNLNHLDWFWMPTNNWTMSIVTTTMSNLSATTHPLPILQALPLIFLLATVVLLCIFGNILVILSVFTFRPLRTVQNFFIVSLAFSDMLVAIIVMPFHIVTHVLQRWIFGRTTR